MEISETLDHQLLESDTISHEVNADKFGRNLSADSP